MDIQKINANSQVASFKGATKTETAKTETPKSDKKINGKAIAIASAAAIAMGLATIAIIKNKNIKAIPEVAKEVYTKIVREATENASNKNIQKLNNIIQTEKMNTQIAEVAQRTSKAGVADKTADLAEAFGAKVHHVAQKASITK